MENIVTIFGYPTLLQIGLRNNIKDVVLFGVGSNLVDVIFTTKDSQKNTPVVKQNITHIQTEVPT